MFHIRRSNIEVVHEMRVVFTKDWSKVPKDERSAVKSIKPRDRYLGDGKIPGL